MPLNPCSSSSTTAPCSMECAASTARSGRRTQVCCVMVVCTACVEVKLKVKENTHAGGSKQIKNASARTRVYKRPTQPTRTQTHAHKHQPTPQHRSTCSRKSWGSAGVATQLVLRRWVGLGWVRLWFVWGWVGAHMVYVCACALLRMRVCPWSRGRVCVTDHLARVTLLLG